MKEIWNWIQIVFAAIGGGIGWFLGGADGFLYALIAFVVIDYITGVMCAIVDHKLSSTVGFKGIFKKVLIFISVRPPLCFSVFIIDILRRIVCCSNNKATHFIPGHTVFGKMKVSQKVSKKLAPQMA